MNERSEIDAGPEEVEIDDAPEEAVDGAPEEASKDKRTTLDKLEQGSRIFVNVVKIFLLAAIGALGFWFKAEQDNREDQRQLAARKTELSKPWLDEALRVLREQTSRNPESGFDSPLRDWAIQVFEEYSPVYVGEGLKRDLQSGALKFSHMIKSTKTIEWAIDLSSFDKADCTKLGRGVQFVDLEIPKELSDRYLTGVILESYQGQAEIDKLFQFARATVLLDQYPKKVGLVYALRDDMKQVDSVRFLVSATFVVEEEALFVRSKTDEVGKDVQMYYTAEGKPYDHYWESGSYYVYDYSYDDDTLSAEERETKIREREERRKSNFENGWRRAKGLSNKTYPNEIKVDQD